MYKIVPITALTSTSTFISSDKIIEISQDRTKMSVGINDYEHKNKQYLSTCIENADRSLNAYLSAYDHLSNTYITASSLSNVYITQGSLITKETVEKILSSDAFLTKDGCKAFEANCIAYINELKNKAVSIIMAKLNESFIAQNSVNRKVYGQISGNTPFVYVSKILHDETYANYKNPNTGYNFNFKKGEFTLAKLLFFEMPDANIKQCADTYLDYYEKSVSSYFMNSSFSSVDAIIKKLKVGDTNGNNVCTFNAPNKTDFDLKITVPSTSFDFVKKQSIPITKLIEFVLKNQIYRVITNICNHYAALMISVPQTGSSFQPTPN